MAPSPVDSCSHFAVVSHGTPSDSASARAAVADGASPTTDPIPCPQKEVSAARVVVLPDPAGPTSTSSTRPEVMTASAAARWSGASAPRWRSVRSWMAPSISAGRCGAPVVSAASMSAFSAPSSSVEVNSDSPTRRVIGSRLSSRCTHAAAASVVTSFRSARRSAAAAIRSSFEARTAAAPRFHVVHTERRVDTSSSTWATIAARTSGPTSCACNARP